MTLRVCAFLLSLAAPGAGHFLLGAIRRGVAWAVGVALLGVTLLFVMPIAFSAIVVGILVAALARLASAVDTLWISGRRPRWEVLLVAWALLLVGTWVLEEPVKNYYRMRYAHAFTIPSGSMQPALLMGDYVMADHSRYRAQDPRRGDVVVFKHPQDERRRFVKRIIGLSGETIAIRGNEVHVNGQRLPEPYARFEAARDIPGQCGYAYGCEPTRVPARSFFVMGDNRDNSPDSRHWGFVRRDQIVGRVFTIYWSWDGSRQWPRFDRVGRSL